MGASAILKYLFSQCRSIYSVRLRFASLRVLDLRSSSLMVDLYGRHTLRLAEKLIPRSYHALDNGWTPLSRNPCWLSIAFHCLQYYMKRNRLVLISSVGYYRQRLLPTNHKVTAVGGKSFADDLVASGYCKCESSLCATIHWGFSRVSLICSSLF